MKILASPQVLTRDGQEAQVNIITEGYYMLTPRESRQNAALSEPKLEKIETGTKLAATPHIPDENDNIVLKMDLELGGIREASDQKSNHQAFYLFAKPEIVRSQPNGG